MKNLLLDFTGSIDESIFEFLEYSVIARYCPIKELDEISYRTFSHLRLSEYNAKLTVPKIKQILQKKRRNYHIISVEAKSSKISSFAARDNRIDAIRISNKSSLSIFNLRYARRLEEFDKFVILDISSMFSEIRASSIRPLLRIINIMRKTSLKFILTNNPDNIHKCRSYRSLQSVGKIINLLNNQTSVDTLIDRIEINIRKINGEIPFVGIRIGDED